MLAYYVHYVPRAAEKLGVVREYRRGDKDVLRELREGLVWFVEHYGLEARRGTPFSFVVPLPEDRYEGAYLKE